MNFLVKMQIESLRPVSWVLKAWVADSILIGQTLDHNFIKIDCNKIIFVGLVLCLEMILNLNWITLIWLAQEFLNFE